MALPQSRVHLLAMPAVWGSNLRGFPSLGIQGLSNNEVDAVRQTILSWTDALVKGDLPLWDSYWAEGGIFDAARSRLRSRSVEARCARRNASLRRHQEGNIFGLGYRWPRRSCCRSNNIEIEPKSGGAPTVYKQLVVLRQQENGKWLVQAVMFNSLASSD
jgi:hypothetical protein